MPLPRFNPLPAPEMRCSPPLYYDRQQPTLCVRNVTALVRENSIGTFRKSDASTLPARMFRCAR